MYTVNKDEVLSLIKKKNYPMAEILLRIHLRNEPCDYEAIYLLGYIASTLNLTDFALRYFSEAMKLAPNWQPAHDAHNLILNRESRLQQVKNPETVSALESPRQYILIKAWGCGFWSDVSHVLGQLLIAELTERIPVIHWGRNSLYGDGSSANAFEFYFEPLSKVSISDLQNDVSDIWPPKWHKGNLGESNVNTLNGPYSRIAGIYLLGRSEKLVVSDFFTSVYDLRPWIPEGHHLYGLSIDELWRYLVRKYLHPQKEIMDQVDKFHENHFASADFLAVHMRGSDKIREYTTGNSYIDEYISIIEEYLSSKNLQKIFLMTDDTRILKSIKKIYGNKVITTDCHRTENAQGVHKLPIQDRRKLGNEIMVDVYLAARAGAFVGSATTNPSRFVGYLKDWPEDTINLLGVNPFHRPNLFLHKW